MDIKLQVDASRFHAAMSRWRSEFRQETDKAFRLQVLLFIQNLIRALPPYASGGKGRSFKGAKGERDYRAGQRSVYRNIFRAVMPAVLADWRDPKIRLRVRAIAAAGDEAGMQQILDHTGFAGWRVRPFSKRLHTQQLDSRGRARLGRVMTLNTEEWEQYLHDKWRNIGKMRASFLPAFMRLNGKRSSIPAFVWEQAGKAPGSASVTMNERDSSVTMDSTAKGVRFQRNAITRALRQRTRAMIREIEDGVNKSIAKAKAN